MHAGGGGGPNRSSVVDSTATNNQKDVNSKKENHEAEIDVLIDADEWWIRKQTEGSKYYKELLQENLNRAKNWISYFISLFVLAIIGQSVTIAEVQVVVLVFLTEMFIIWFLFSSFIKKHYTKKQEDKTVRVSRKWCFKMVTDMIDFITLTIVFVVIQYPFILLGYFWSSSGFSWDESITFILSIMAWILFKLASFAY